jgi:glycosyltransferase involved in cell wall biosynthesis
MKRPLFSIITVSLNAEKDIIRTIKGVIQQTCKDYEYIIIDGGSTDKTLEIINNYSSYVEKFISESDSGIYAAMNKGARLASGQYIYYMNAGDWFYDKHILKMVKNKINANAGFDIYYGTINKVFNSYSILSKTKYKKKNLLLGKIPSHQAIFLKLSELAKLGYFDEKYKACADIDLMIRAYKKNLSSMELDLTISNFSYGGKSSNKKISYVETYEIIMQHFGFFWATLFKIRKIYLEQGIKKILLSLKLDGVYNYLAKLNNQR